MKQQRTIQFNKEEAMKKQEVVNIRGRPGERASPSSGKQCGNSGQYLGRQQLADKNIKGDFR
jgi:hypothetical protein